MRGAPEAMGNGVGPCRQGRRGRRSARRRLRHHRRLGRCGHQQRSGGDQHSITVGHHLDPDRPIASNFSSLIYGEKAYFDYIDAQGGINGRKIDYKYALDDARQRDDVQPAGQHADQSGPRVRHHRRGHRVVRAQLLRRGEDPDLRLQRLGQLGRTDPTSSPPAGRSSTTPPRALRSPTWRTKAHANSVAFLAYGVAVVGRRLPGRGEGPDLRRVQGRLHRLQDRLPGYDRRHRRAAHEGRPVPTHRELHGRRWATSTWPGR